MLENPWVSAFTVAHYMYYAFFAWGVILVRLAMRRFTRAEYLLLAVFLAGIALQILQFSFEGGKYTSFAQLDSSSDQRYFGSMAAGLWAWAAVGLADLCRIRGVAGWVFRMATIAAVCVVLFVETVPYLTHMYKYGFGRDAMVAAERIAPKIKADYAGPSRYGDIKYSLKEYYTANRPVVFSNFGAAAWAVRGQAEGPNWGIYPNPPDYLFMNMSKGGYAQGGRRFKPADFELVAETRGTVCRWKLFRRKGVPHR